MSNQSSTRARRALKRVLGDRAATDPILVIAAIAVSLVLLVGGSFAVAGIIDNGKDLNARNDLQLIATAEAAVHATAGGYASYARTAAGVESGEDADPEAPGTQLLSGVAVGFTLSEGTGVRVVAADCGWIAGTKSGTGKVYLRSSATATDFRPPATEMPLPDCFDAADVTALVDALGGDDGGTAAPDPGGEPATVVATVSTFAGSPTAGYANDVGTTARFKTPRGLAVDSAGNVYVADSLNAVIRKVTPSATVTLVAGIPDTFWYGDGAAAAAYFHTPGDVAVDSAGNVYVADTNNHRIRKISPGGEVTTLAGSAAGFADGVGAAARFQSPEGVAVDSAGNVYVGDTGNYRIRKISPGGEVTTLAGSTMGYSDGTGTAAMFGRPARINVDAAGNVYVAESTFNMIRRVTPAGEVTTVAGAFTAGSDDGPVASARFTGPYAADVDAAGNIYVAEWGGHRIRRIGTDGQVTTVAGSTAGYTDGVGTEAQLQYPLDLAVGPDGSVFVVSNNMIRKLTF